MTGRYNCSMDFPRLLMVRQKFPDRALRDIPGEVRGQLAGSGFAARLKPGARVAIGVGSRGIHNLATIVRAAVDYWQATGMQPFLFPAMGSHGAGTAEGQAAVLAHYGITEATMGCPVQSQLDVVALGKTPEGIEVFMDKLAFEADGVMLVSRVKWHTDFAGRIESGLNKMMAIGLGKLAGAQKYHIWSKRLGLENVVLSVGRRVLESGRMIGGLAILEDANHDTARVEAVPIENMEAREAELLAMVKAWAGRIPCDLDILVIDEMGKNISGEYNPWPNTPQIRRIFVRGLTDLTYGNAVGIGMADVLTDRLVDRIDWNPTRINALTAGNPAGMRLPMHFPTDRECLQAIASGTGRLDSRELTVGWIRNTLELGLLALSETLRPEIEANPQLDIVAGPFEMPFGTDGNLEPLPEPAAALA